MEANAVADTRTDWTAEEVAARFADAADTAHKLPRVRPGGYFNPWMTLAMQVPERYPRSRTAVPAHATQSTGCAAHVGSLPLGAVA